MAELSTDFPERIQPNKTLYLGGRHVKLVLASVRPHQEGLLLGFEGVTTPEQAGLYRNQAIFIPYTEAQELPEGEYYFHELVGMQVCDETGRSLGRLTEILETGANDVYVVKDESGVELLLPAIPEVILDVDVPAG